MDFSFKTFFSFRRKTARLEYFLRGIIINLPLLILSSLPSLFLKDGMIALIILGVLILIMVALIIASLTLVFQRLNDLGQSKWMALLAFIPLVNFLFIVYLLFAPGETSKQNSIPKETEETGKPDTQEKPQDEENKPEEA